MQITDPFVFVDVETTGTNPNRDRVLEIGIIRFEAGKIVDKLDTIVNPSIWVPDEIRSLTGITQKDIDKAPLFDEIIGKVRDLINGCVFVAHNARFDYAFLKKEFYRFDSKFSAKVLCSVKLASKLYPNITQYNLDYLVKHFNIPVVNRHRAYPDAKAIFDFFNIALLNFSEDHLVNVFKELTKTPSLPSKINPKELEDLPEGPGVYIFYSDDKTIPLYVGKSINLRDRIKSHFSSDYHSHTDIKITQSITKIEIIQTAGELGALIREAKIIKDTQPLYNRQLRRSVNGLCFMEINNSGYKTGKLEPLTCLNKTNVPKTLAFYKSKKQAIDSLYQTAEEYNLCPKLLGLEKGKGTCFNFQISRCNGACINKENKLKYNIRFIQAFSNTRMISWPFKGACFLIEEWEGKKEYHLIDNWYYLGSIKEENEHFNQKKQTAIFDWDTYKILKRQLLNKKVKIIEVDHIKTGSDITSFEF